MKQIFLICFDLCKKQATSKICCLYIDNFAKILEQCPKIMIIYSQKLLGAGGSSLNTMLPSIVYFKRLGSRHIHKEIEIS